jgi:hypothetical protein
VKSQGRLGVTIKKSQGRLSVRRLWCIRGGAAVRGGVYVLGYKNGVECNADVRFVLAAS